MLTGYRGHRGRSTESQNPIRCSALLRHVETIPTAPQSLRWPNLTPKHSTALHLVIPRIGVCVWGAVMVTGPIVIVQGVTRTPVFDPYPTRHLWGVQGSPTLSRQEPQS